jgi:hypothetical protein
VACGSEDGTVTVWDVAPAPNQCPDWFLPLIEAVSGQVLDAQGLLGETKLDRVATLNELRLHLNSAPGADPWTVWGRWFLAEPAGRTISPFCNITVRD